MKIFHFASAILAAPFLSTGALAEDTHLEEAKAVFDWVSKTKDAYLNPKVEVRREIPGDPSSPIGVYATETIEVGEDIVNIPYEILIEPDNYKEPFSNMMCGTIRAVAREMRLGAESRVGPYAVYLKGEKDASIPSTWSKPAQELLLQVLETDKGELLPPERPVNYVEEWVKRCGGDINDELGVQAVVMVVARADDSSLIPVYDSLNHRNGNWTNTITFDNEEEGWQKTTADKTIAAGEQIYNSYNMCENCDGRKMDYGTAEILRDYGFVESFPQRWHYFEEGFHFNLDQIEDGKYIVTWDPYMRPTKTDLRLMEQCRVWFRWEIRRLKRFKNIDLNELKKTDHGIPDYELETLIKFVDANIVAMTAGLESLGPSPKKGEVTTTRADSEWPLKREGGAEVNAHQDKETCVADEDFGGCMAPIDIAPLMQNTSHYDPFEWEYDDLDYQRQACDNRELMRFEDFDDVEWMKTHYQALNFMRNPKTDNTCMDLDNIVQICDDYRPQYHEYSTHGAGRFVKDVKRVIFIGGGDSMLLHEALKYPNLELVVGLEIDQTVVRKSFKYFRTSPHFEDERVEWWFGDATKSLLLLPEDYWGSFDLVLVDLSETVMSFSVTSELDVFDALALLLNPEGVIVKNEHYHEKFQRLFDYTAEISYESPVVCFQVMVFGSNNVDFFRDPVYDHGIETKMYESLHTPENRYDLMHGYRKNIAPEEKCNLNIPAELTTQGTAAGILEIINAENCSIKLDESIVEIVKKTAATEGFTLVSELFEDDVGFVILKEGFISARIVPEFKYVGFDVNLWGKSSKIKSLRKALAAAVGSGDMSSYKVVVGGMYGSSSWKEDQRIQGPKLKQLRNCEEDVVREGSLDEKTASAVAIGETVPLTLSSAVAAVVCGKEGQECVAYDTLKEQSNVNHVFPIYECSDASEFECENQVSKQIKDQVFVNGVVRKLNLLVMDSSSSLAMHQIVGSVLESKTRELCFEEHNVVVNWMEDTPDQSFRKEFLDRYRKICWLEPASLAEIVLKAEGKTYELGVVSSNNERANYEYEGLQNRIKSRLSSSDVLVELRNIHGALFKYMHDWDPKKFRHEDYENKPQIENYENQKPLGRQNIYQIVKATGVDELGLDTAKILSYLDDAMAFVGLQSIVTKQYEDVGDGALIVTASSEGYITLVWDGRENISLNFFTENEEIGMPEKFVKTFLKSSGKKLQIGLRDDQPRGVNRVINFPSDIDPRFRKPRRAQEFFAQQERFE